MNWPEWVSPDGRVRLINADCLEVLPTLEAGSVDAVVTDPPYPDLVGGYDRAGFESEAAVGTPKNATISVGDEWDANLDWVQDAKRIARLGAMVFCTHHSIPEVALAFADWRRVMLLTWYKRNSPPTGKNVPRFTCEYIWCFASQPGLHWDRAQSTMIDMPKLATGCMASKERLTHGVNKQAVHPTQKPTKLMASLLEYTDEGMAVLDPFAGVATTAVACVRMNRRCIAIERDAGFYAKGKERLEREYARTALFDHTEAR